MATRGIRATREFALLEEFIDEHVSFDRLDQLGAHGVGIGFKEVGRERTETLALVFLVERKQRAAELADEPIPPSFRFVPRGDGREVEVPTDVIEVDPPQQMEDPGSRLRPVPGGSSISIDTDGATLGGWLWDVTDKTVVGLSNSHAFKDAIGAGVMQPSQGDGGNLPADRIGTVKRSIPLKKSPAVNVVDAAICSVDNPKDVAARVIDVGPAVFDIDEAVPGMAVEKFGQSTGLTTGIVKLVNHKSGDTGGGLVFDGQIVVERAEGTSAWMAAGDSGSLLVRQEAVAGDVKPVVGLIWGGTAEIGVASPIQKVFEELRVTTLCSGLFGAFIDALFERPAEGQEGPRGEMPEPPAPGPEPGHRPPDGEQIGRDVQALLARSQRGRIVTELIDTHRAEITELLLGDEELWQAAVAALAPLVAGVATAADVAQRPLTAEDVERISLLAEDVSRRASPELGASLEQAVGLLRGAEGRSPAEIFAL